MSGAEFALSAVCSLPSRSSFWIVWYWIVTFGCCAWNCFAAAWKKFRPSGPFVAFSQTVTVTLPADEPPLPPLLPPAQPVAASAMPNPIATAVAPRAFLAIVEIP